MTTASPHVLRSLPLLPAHAAGDSGAHLAAVEGCCRKVWNLALDRQQKNRAAGEKHASYVTMAKWLTEWRGSAEYGYLKEPPVHMLQNVLKALDGAFQRFFRKDGVSEVQAVRRASWSARDGREVFAVDSANGRVKLPKVGWPGTGTAGRCWASPRR